MTKMLRSFDLLQFAGVLHVFLLNFTLVTCYSRQKCFIARHFIKTISTSSLSGKVDGQWTICPPTSLLENEYLEIRWNNFTTLSSSMPECEKDYAVVFITKRYRSLGRFCSGGMHDLPFRVSSYDGYAKIKFSLSTSDGAHVSLSYQIKSVNSYDTCNPSDIGVSSYAGVVSSYGWPHTDKPHSCLYFVRTKKDMVTKIVGMDFNVGQRACEYCTGEDYVKVTAWKFTDHGSQKIDLVKWSRHERSLFSLETKHTFVEIDVNMRSDQFNGRGFTAGVLKYSLPVQLKRSSSSSIIPVIVGSSVGIVVIVLTVITLLCFAKWRMKRGASSRGNNSHTGLTVVPSSGRNAVQPVLPPVEMPDMPPPYVWKEDQPYLNYPPPNEAPPPYAAAISNPGFTDLHVAEASHAPYGFPQLSGAELSPRQ